MRGVLFIGRKPKVPFEIKVSVIEGYLNGKKGITKISDELSVSKSSVKQWVRIYKSKGVSGLKPRLKNNNYSKELKIAAVEDYLSGNGSLNDISTKYGLRSKSQLST